MSASTAGIFEEMAEFFRAWLEAGDPGVDPIRGEQTGPLTVERRAGAGSFPHRVRDLVTEEEEAAFEHRPTACIFVASRLSLQAKPLVEIRSDPEEGLSVRVQGETAGQLEEPMDDACKEAFRSLYRVAQHGDALAWLLQAAGPHTLARAFRVLMAHRELLDDLP